MESVFTWIFAVIFGPWMLLTLVRAWGYHALIRFRVPRTVWPLLPNWSLFAPKPGMADYYLFYRDQSGEEEPGPWQLAYGPEPRKWAHGLWNPNKVQAKAIFDMVQQLAGIVNQMQAGGEQDLMNSAPYQHLLYYIRQLPRQDQGKNTQFSIVMREPATGYEATFLVSPYYPI